jgi:hypothetical protein
MTEYRESEGYLAPELDEQPITDDPSLLEQNPDVELKSLQTYTITLDQIAQALKPVEHRLHSSARFGGISLGVDARSVERGNKKPVKIADVENAIDLIEKWLPIAAKSIPGSREVKILSAKLKALKELKANELGRA